MRQSIKVNVHFQAKRAVSESLYSILLLHYAPRTRACLVYARPLTISPRLGRPSKKEKLDEALSFNRSSWPRCLNCVSSSITYVALVISPFSDR